MPAHDLVTDGIVLAAGLGSRMGGGKMLLPWRGRPFLAHCLETAAASGVLRRVVAVLGRDADRTGPVAESCRRSLEAAGTGLEIAVNPRPEDGMSSSLRLGLEGILRGGDAPDALMILLGDQPLIRPETLRLLHAAFRRARAAGEDCPAAAPAHAGRRGNPVILDRSLFPDLALVEGDRGARDILAGLGPRLLLVPTDDPGVTHDVDTPEAHAELLTRHP